MLSVERARQVLGVTCQMADDEGVKALLHQLNEMAVLALDHAEHERDLRCVFDLEAGA